jgi:hypothetical protein
MCLNTEVEQVHLPVIPEQCLMGHPWRPGTAELSWEPCECAAAPKNRCGHIAVRCLHPRCTEEWLSPQHDWSNLRGPLGNHRPGYR